MNAHIESNSLPQENACHLYALVCITNIKYLQDVADVRRPGCDLGYTLEV
jgi:hypothetical protein